MHTSEITIGFSLDIILFRYIFFPKWSDTFSWHFSGSIPWWMIGKQTWKIKKIYLEEFWILGDALKTEMLVELLWKSMEESINKFLENLKHPWKMYLIWSLEKNQIELMKVPNPKSNSCRHVRSNTRQKSTEKQAVLLVVMSLWTKKK